MDNFLNIEEARVGISKRSISLFHKLFRILKWFMILASKYLNKHELNVTERQLVKNL